MSIATFASQEKFRAWLEQNYESTAELLVRCDKTHAEHKGLTYRQALDEALAGKAQGK